MEISEAQYERIKGSLPVQRGWITEAIWKLAYYLYSNESMV